MCFRSVARIPERRESITATCHPANRHRDDTADAASPVAITTRSKFLVMPWLLFLHSTQNCYLTIVCFTQNRAMSGPLAQIITHDDAHRHHDCDGGRGRRKRRLRAERGSEPLQDPLRSPGAYPRSRGRAECEEPGFEFQSANADFPDARQGA